MSEPDDMAAQLEHERWRIKELLADYQNLEADLAAKRREIGRLKGELERQQTEDPSARQTLEVLEFWRVETAKARTTERAEQGRLNAKIPLDRERAKKTRAALRDFSPDQLKRCVVGATKSPWHQGSNPDGKVFDDIPTIFRDEAQIEKLIDLADGEGLKLRPVPDPPSVPVVEPTPLDRAIIALRKEFGDDRAWGDWDEAKGRHVQWFAACPVLPNVGHTPMRILTRQRFATPADWSSLEFACAHGCTHEDLADAVRMVELRVDRRRDEAVSRARAAA